jgi:hypothetical protein
VNSAQPVTPALMPFRKRRMLNKADGVSNEHVLNVSKHGATSDQH